MTTYAPLERVTTTDCLVIPIFEDVSFDKQLTSIDKTHGGLVAFVKDSHDFEGKKMQMSLLYTQHADIPRLLMVGLGKKEEFSMKRYDQAIGAAVIYLQGKKITNAAVLVPDAVVKQHGAEAVARETVVAMETAQYAFNDYKQEDAKVARLTKIELIAPQDKQVAKEWKKGIEKGTIIGESVNFTRQLGNTPPSVMTPTLLAKEAQGLAKLNPKLTVKVLSKPEIEKLKMGCFLGVAQGSDQPPKFIILEYKGGNKKDTPTVLVGKGITFDSGGLSIKPGDYMTDMKFDMLGGATVLGIMRAVALLGLKKNIVGLVPACENMPSGTAYRPDDILTAMNGTTVEIQNTDAEGRLILSDALCYAKKYNPKEVFDFATLTGACVVALGNERSGLFTPEDKLAEKLDVAAKNVGEQLWRLPLGEEFSEAIKSEVADIKNLGGVGGPRYAGASTAAAFLQHFTEYPWAHIDLSSSYWGGKGKPWIRHGANGFGVQTMIDYLSR